MKRLIIIALWIFIGCSSPNIATNSDSTADFKSYSTFCFSDYNPELPVARPDYDNIKNRAVIEAAIIGELEKLGYVKVERNSELMVQYDIIITEKVDPRVDSAVVYKPWADTKMDSYNYTEGLLVIRLIDRPRSKLIWQGSLTGILDQNPDNFGKKIDGYILDLFAGLGSQMH